jgi:hypothetical protein
MDDRMFYDKLKDQFTGAAGEAYRQAAMTDPETHERYALDANRLQELEGQFGL